ncbi:hypothetical protein [Streptomyces fradiae]|uniref:Uncharacterized protein n=1 Tax=Streptomyces fradiae ATCC 10745 = DSM 40063 TaxID=1319510 RepID=A0A1Y2NPV0_STRFR|nr:hypothetical protein [Streptomyces fradiae]KAF0651393.1 hypothetical protein K701_02510 [Streptomyces fradiae ATCC 10745 = DSM 40063]OSY49524.1 hypothetical protein BG846_04877 [Streptomyces fradiae ATCC 10745 = DSM 40063]
MVAGTANAMFRPGASSTVPLVARDVRGANGVLRISEAFTAPGGPAPAGPAPAGPAAAGPAAAGPAVGAFGTDRVLLVGVVVALLTVAALLAARPIRTPGRAPARA